MFTNNVNVTVEDFSDGLASYDEISIREFRQAGIDLIDHQMTSAFAQYEYRTRMMGRDLHLYQRVLSTDTKVYLITATVSSDEWEEYEDAAKSIVNSFSIE